MRRLSKILCGVLSSLIIASAFVMSASAATSFVPFEEFQQIKNMKVVFSLTNTKSGVKISWDEVKPAVKLTIKRRLSTSKKYTTLKTLKKGKQGAFTDKTVKAGKTYKYTITATSKSWSDYPAKTVKKTKTIVRLTAPKNVTAKLIPDYLTDDGNNIAYIDFKDVKGAEAYAVFRAELGDDGKMGLYWLIDIYNGYDVSLVSGHIYKYKVVAFSGKSAGVVSSASNAIRYIQTPNITACSDSLNGGITLNSKYSFDADECEIYRRAEGEKEYTLIKTLFGHMFEKLYTDTSCEDGKKYAYYVKIKCGRLTAQSNKSAVVYQANPTPEDIDATRE